MDKTRIVKFLDSLEERGIMAADQQVVVLRAETDDLGAASNSQVCVNRSVESCGGTDNHNAKCTNIGKAACVGSSNDFCENKLSDTVVSNLQTDSCKGGT